MMKARYWTKCIAGQATSLSRCSASLSIDSARHICEGINPKSSEMYSGRIPFKTSENRVEERDANS